MRFAHRADARMFTRRQTGAAALAAVAAVALAACGSGNDPLATGDNAAEEPAAADVIRVGSADFPESTLLAEIYAHALEDAGLQVERRFGIGSREVYLGALEDGSIDLIPEYSGNLLLYYDEGATASTPDDVYAALEEALPEGLTVLEPAEAQNKDQVVVTGETAQEYDLSGIGDLEPVAPELVLGGPREWERRESSGVPALERVYGLTFESYEGLSGAQPAQWLANGQIDVANIFSTDPAMVENDFVALEDTKNLFPAQNVLPLANAEKVTDEVRSALNAVSAELDTATLAELDARMVTDKEDAGVVAEDWLASLK